VIEFLLEGFAAHADDDAIVWNDQTFSYRYLRDEVVRWEQRLAQDGIALGAVTAIEGDFSPTAVALLLALIERRCVIVPLARGAAKRDEFLAQSQAEIVIDVAADDAATFHRTGVRAAHTLYDRLRERGSAGLVLFSSGSTGKSKGAVHDFSMLLEKFKVRRKRQRTITFLLYDHIGGVNTLLHTLSNQGTVITVRSRTADDVLAAIAKHRAEVLPTSPTFINMILLSEAYQRHDLSSLRLVTYGTEPMLESTLARFHAVLPHVTLQQTYGLSEVGILRSKSRDWCSLWLKVGGEGFATRVVDGILHIKATSAMLGYLEHPSPFTEDGWFVTGDAVEVDGEWLRILGRTSELINVGGEKVYPAEIESVLETMPNVAEAGVYGEKHALVGQIVCADVMLAAPEELRAFQRRLRAWCKTRLAPFKVPAKVRLVDGSLGGARFKKRRGVD
jgi:long-chain acyl-CoA synthetase